MRWVRAIWTFLGSTVLSVWVLLSLVSVLCCGYFLFESSPTTYEPLNRLLLWDWIASYGWSNIGNSWWFFCFLLLLGLLVINTFVCTWQKVLALARRGAIDSRLDFVLRFSPHVMHAAFIIILASHLITYVFALNAPNNIVLLGKEITLPGSELRLKLQGVESDFYDGQRLAFFQGRALSQKITLSLKGADGSVTRKDLGYCSPVWYGGYSIHLKNYKPKNNIYKTRTIYANLIIRRDPGVKAFFFGTAVFAVGLIAYLWQALRLHRRRASREA